MEPRSKHITAFSTRSGLYQFRYMPFGLKTAPAVFTRMIRKVVDGIPNIFHYFDDVLVATDSWEEHLDTLRTLFSRVRKANLTIKPKKTELGATSVVFLGHKIGEGIVRPMTQNVDKIRQACPPRTKKQVQSFLGLTGYYRDFIPDYAQISYPLSELIKKRAPNRFTWTQEHQLAFETLKTALTNRPVLRAPDLSKEFILRTDASDKCLGAVLLQEYDERLHPVSYASRKLLPREAGYSAIERECLAVVWAIQKFHVYLYGKKFTVETDHQPLLYISSARQMNTRVLRWSLILSEYDFSVRYIPGASNVGADYLSRLQ